MSQSIALFLFQPVSPNNERPKTFTGNLSLISWQVLVGFRNNWGDQKAICSSSSSGGVGLLFNGSFHLLSYTLEERNRPIAFLKFVWFKLQFRIFQQVKVLPRHHRNSQKLFWMESIFVILFRNKRQTENWAALLAEVRTSVSLIPSGDCINMAVRHEGDGRNAVKVWGLQHTGARALTLSLCFNARTQ